MMSSNDTMPFAPVHEEQNEEVSVIQERKDRAEPAAVEQLSAGPRVIELKSAPRIIPRKKMEIIRIVQP